MLSCVSPGNLINNQLDWVSALKTWRLLPYHPLVSVAEIYAEELIGSPGIDVLGEKDASGRQGYIARIKQLDWDSAFFDVRMARLEPLIAPVTRESESRDAADLFVRKCLWQAEQLGIQHLSAQIHCSDTITASAFQRNGFFLADTIVEYRLDLSHWSLDTQSMCVSKATGEHKPSLSRIAAECFGNRSLNANRFINDPTFSSTKVAQMYALWIEKSVDRILADEVFVYLENSTPAGFITVALPSTLHPDIGTIPLNAVDPQFQGRGIYSKLVATACTWLKEQGASHVEIRTQLPNLAVHRTWSKIAAPMSLALHTFHCPDVPVALNGMKS